MKKTLAISSVLVGVVFLAGCGQQQASQTQPTKSTPTDQQPSQSVEVKQNNDLAKKNFTLPNHGTLILSMPKNWISNLKQPENNLPPTITIDTPQKNLEVLITPIWNAKDGTKPYDLAEIKRLVENDGNGIVKSAVEKNYTLKELNGIRSKGYYFDMLTDKKYETVTPPAGEYKYVMRAGVGIDELLLSVTFLSSSKESEQITQGLEMLKNLEHTK